MGHKGVTWAIHGSTMGFCRLMAGKANESVLSEPCPPVVCRLPVGLSFVHSGEMVSGIDPRLFHHRTGLLNMQLLSKCHLNRCSRFRVVADLVFPTSFFVLWVNTTYSG